MLRKIKYHSILFLPGSPSRRTTLLFFLDLPGFIKFRREIIPSSALPALKGGLTEAEADFGRRIGDSDLDLNVILPLFSGRRGHSHKQWCSLSLSLWLWCLGLGVKTSSSSVSELLSVWRENNALLYMFKELLNHIQPTSDTTMKTS